MRNLLLFLLVFVFGCNSGTEIPDGEKINQETKSGQLIIFHAGSLSVPFKEIQKAYALQNPEVEILMESSGSRKSARKVSDLHRECDIMASADYRVINELLIPDYANWNIKFASNEMAIVYDENSRYADKINTHNWYEILLNDSVIYGRSDPNSDPCGYRAVICTQLAEKYYNIDELSRKILSKNQNYIRPKEVDLLSLLESNSLDYVFIYRSVAQQHKLKYIVLPDSISLKNPACSEFYAEASCNVSGKSPGDSIRKKGEPMIYGVTICRNAPNYELAVDFLEFVFTKGLKILEKNGQPSLVPAPADGYDNIPASLQEYAKPIQN
ncbi:MAG: tungstate ABC transporter substrate-binding protein WtpA [Marinilabiliales bacterium]|nr:MAG: tungstate ABC transporter substrate-binding protein WtpA [Marinilabiliales bacterium]